MTDEREIDERGECVVDGQWGIYVAQTFAEKYSHHGMGIPQTDWDTLLNGPDDPDYDEVWDAVLDNARFTDKNGQEWAFYQDSDVFMSPSA